MSRVDIFFTVSGQRISQDIDNPELHSGDKRHFYAVFDLEEAFSEAEPKAVFTKRGGSVLMDLVKRDDGKFECVIPWEAMFTSGFFTVGIFGGDMMLTNALSVKVFQGCTPEGGAPLEPTPGWFDAIEAQVRGIEKGLEDKVDKVTGKGLSTNDYTDAEKKKVKDTASGLSKKVDKVDGKGLSTNDYTDVEKQKLSGIEQGAEKNKVTSVAGKQGDVTLKKSDIGLDKVDNTSDAEKPISNPTKEALDALGQNIQSVQKEIPKSVSQLANDSDFVSDTEVDSKVSTHNTAEDAHSDIRLKVKEISDRLSAFLDTDDTTLDQLSEIVDYINDNKELIDSITTSKVSISDIIDNLTTNVSDKPLSAKQGVILKALIDAITVPTKVSELTNDKGYLTENKAEDQYVKKVTGKDLSTNDYTDADKQKVESVEEGAEVNTVKSVAGKQGDVTLTKEDVGLGNVDNTSDENKPLSKAARDKFEAVEKNILDVQKEIPESVGQLTNDRNFISSTEADNKVSSHNTAEDAHGDIRLIIKDITDRLNAFLDTDDTTLDQLSEIVEYITSNKDLIDNITTSKVNVSDIIDNLTTNVSDKPLSAKQGAELKALIDALNASVSEIDSHMPYISEDGWWYVWNADKKAYVNTGVKAKGESITHSWEGTVLTITSASGSSSADLKGDAGENGHSPILGPSKYTFNPEIEQIIGTDCNYEQLENGDIILATEASTDMICEARIILNNILDKYNIERAELVGKPISLSLKIREQSQITDYIVSFGFIGSQIGDEIEFGNVQRDDTLEVTITPDASVLDKDNVRIISVEIRVKNLDGIPMFANISDLKLTVLAGEDEDWYVWDDDKKAYVYSGIKAQGDDGYTPQRGKDYWTDEDKTEIKGYVDEAILGGAW